MAAPGRSPPRAANPPLVGLTVGDPAGIGPEIAIAALRDERVRKELRPVVLGPAALRPGDVAATRGASRAELEALEGAAWIETPADGTWDLGRPQRSSGAAALEALRAGARIASEGLLDALVTGPVSKEALHLAGEHVEGQTELLGRWAGCERFQMIAVAGPLRVMLLTRHLPLRRAIEALSVERVLDHLRLLDETLRGWGFARPRLALAGLNPHAGEGGLLGSEEAETLAPAAELARAERIDVAGPISPDSVFLMASRGTFDAVLALYHDQAFIPVKLFAPEGGLTVIAGLPYLRVSPAHGTAFDIAGKAVASPRNLVLALRQAAAWCRGLAQAVEI
jgi:4-hydroxythreonine-4-phosphate dehydrogenase